MKRRAALLFALLVAASSLCNAASEGDTASAVKGTLLLRDNLPNPSTFDVSRVLVVKKVVCIEYRRKNSWSTGFAVYKTDLNLVWIDNSWVWQRSCLTGKMGQLRDGKNLTAAVGAALQAPQTLPTPVVHPAAQVVQVATAPAPQPAPPVVQIATAPVPQPVAPVVRVVAAPPPQPVTPALQIETAPVPQPVAPAVQIATAPVPQPVKPAVRVETAPPPHPVSPAPVAVTAPPVQTPAAPVATVASVPPPAPMPPPPAPIAAPTAAPPPVPQPAPAPAVVQARAPVIETHPVMSVTVIPVEIGTVRGATIIDNNQALGKPTTEAPESLADAARRLKKAKQQPTDRP